MNVYFFYEAASCFAALKPQAAQDVVRALTGLRATREMGASGAPRVQAAELVRSVRTDDTQLWVGAFAEDQDLTVVSLGFENPGDQLPARIRALARAQKRPTVGGLSLSESPDAIQESVRALLEEYATRDSSRQPVDLIGSAEAAAMRRRRAALGAQLARSARRWRTSEARRDFRDVLQEAATSPQVVERDGQEVLIIGRGLLERFEQPLSGAALAARFAQNQLAPLRFAEEPATEPEPEIHLAAPAADLQARG